MSDIFSPTETNVESKDQKVTLGGPVDTLYSPGSTVAQGGGTSVNAGVGATVNQSITSTTQGLPTDQVASVLDSIFQANNKQVDSLVNDRADERKAYSDLSAGLVGSLSQTTAGLTNAVKSTQQPETSRLIDLAPYLIIPVIIIMIFR